MTICSTCCKAAIRIFTPGLELPIFTTSLKRRRYNTSRSTTKHLKWSYTQGPADIALRGITVGNLLQQQADKTPDREAYIFCSTGIRKTFSQLLDEVNINPLYKSLELQYVLEKVQCSAIIVSEKFKDQHYYNILFKLVPEMATQKSGSLHSHELPTLKHVITMGKQKYPGAFQFGELLDVASTRAKRAIKDFQNKLQFDDPINIQFTSGTTGYPKGATLSHHNIVNNSYFTGLRLNYHIRKARICVPVPLYHCFGIVLASLQTINHGATCVFPSPAFDAGIALRTVYEERCTALYGVPTMFIDMLNHPSFSDYDLSTLYTGIMGGSPCPVDTMRHVINKMNMENITVCYGTTENSPLTFQSLPDDPLEKRVTTVGQAHPHVEVKLVNEDDEVLTVGVPGELWTRGYTTMLGYWDDHDHTSEVIRQDRWYKTGDIGIMDEEGYCKICGRIKDIIIRGGENINPLEIEQMLYSHPKVKDVQVVGVPDSRLGEEICAWIKLKDKTTATEEEIKVFCREKMAKFKVPKYIQFVEEFPLTVTGKVQKYKIQSEATISLGLEHLIT